MEEIVKHINDTNASFRTIGAGDAKNTDLFLDSEHYELFRDAGEQITVRFNKENLQKAILFIASILPRKYDNSAIHRIEPFSSAFVFDQLALLDAFFTIDGVKVESRTQTWNSRKDIMKKNGEKDNRFYFNGLLEEVSYINDKGEHKRAKFTIRNYLAGGYSDLHIKNADNGIFDVWVTNTFEYKDDGKERQYEEIDIAATSDSLQQIFYGAPGTGKSNTIKRKVDDQGKKCFRTTFHPDSDYSTFVGAYKPTMKPTGVTLASGEKEEIIKYAFVPQAFTKAYIEAWNTTEDVYLVIEEINRGNCAQIFGDLFQLLDRKNGVSEYPIDADADLADQIKEKLTKSTRIDIPAEVKIGKKLMLPSNLYIWATMNTSDQSLFPIDSAFKRRWDWVYIPIKPHEEENYRIEIGTSTYNWWGFLEKINQVIDDTTSSEDKKLGYFFVKAEEKVVKADKFVSKVLFYLWNDVFKNYGFDNPIFSKGENKKFTFSDFFQKDGTTNVVMVNTFLVKLDESIDKEHSFIETKSTEEVDTEQTDNEA